MCACVRSFNVKEEMVSVTIKSLDSEIHPWFKSLLRLYQLYDLGQINCSLPLFPHLKTGMRLMRPFAFGDYWIRWVNIWEMLRECPAYGQCCYCYEHNQMGCSPYVPNYKNMYHFCALFIYAALKDIMKYTLTNLFSQAQSSNKVFIQQLLPSQSIKKLPKLRNHFKTLTVYCHYSKIRNGFFCKYSISF